MAVNTHEACCLNVANDTYLHVIKQHHLYVVFGGSILVLFGDCLYHHDPFEGWKMLSLVQDELSLVWTVTHQGAQFSCRET